MTRPANPDSEILVDYKAAGIPSVPYIMHARNPVEALHWWAVLSTVIGKYDATSIREKIIEGYRKNPRFSPSNIANEVGAPPRRSDAVIASAVITEARKTFTPQRAEQVRSNLQEIIKIEHPELQDQIKNHDWISCCGLDSRISRVEWMKVKGAFGYIPSRTVAITAPNAIKQHINQEENLHCNDGPAVVWDDFGLYFLQGVRVTEQQVVGEISFSQFMKISNSEVRRVLMERKGWTWITEHLSPLDACPDPANPGNFVTLYEIPPGLSLWDRRRLVVMTNASPSRDGKERVYGEFVPRSCNSAMEAQAWAWDVPTEVYKSMIRAT